MMRKFSDWMQARILEQQVPPEQQIGHFWDQLTQGLRGYGIDRSNKAQVPGDILSKVRIDKTGQITITLGYKPRYGMERDYPFDINDVKDALWWLYGEIQKDRPDDELQQHVYLTH